MFTPFAFVKTISPSLPASFISASGGTITTSGDYKIHTFSSVGNTNFVVTDTGSSPNNTLDYLILGGGGGGSGGKANVRFGAGGASGVVRTGSFSPSVTTYVMTVGAGGAGGAMDFSGVSGSSSSAFSITATAGGGGLESGPGGSNADFVGGTFSGLFSGAGAGARANGGASGGNGGNGLQSSINGTSSYYGGGGGGANGGLGGLGGGADAYPILLNAGPYGSGGGGSSFNNPGTSGSAGVIIVSYKFQ